MDADWLPYHPAPTKPRFIPPAGAVDAHCHVFGPGESFPFADERKYTPCDAGKDELWALRDFLGFERSVIVQATCHGADNRALVDALEHSGDSARGVATVRASVTDDELQWLHAAGVRGVRFNFVKRLVNVTPPDVLMTIAERIARLGWHLVIYLEADDLSEYREFIESLPTTVVFDHMARPDLAQPVDGDAFQSFVSLMADNPHIYSKVTCPERLSTQGPPDYPDFVPFARHLVERFPERVLWGTDWPHPNMKSHMPDDGHLVDMIPRIATSDDTRQKLLVDNPMNLYWAAAKSDPPAATDVT
ncbi:MAG: amidohydrolase family protein [Gammaproteobacteria bacterium]|nr:amidohydrolase family protein [Gammaproteobacteria bacterium]